MKILSWDAFIEERTLSSVHTAMSIGVFDGIHLGHRRLFERVLTSDAEETVVITFRYNPRRFLKPHIFPGDITTLEQKLTLLDELGIDSVILIDFSNDFSKLTGREFLTSIFRSCRLDLLVLGDNFRCGNEGHTSAYDAKDILSEHGVEVDIEPPITWKGETLSSTKIRAAVREGAVEEANAMLDRNFALGVGSALVLKENEYRKIEKNGLHQVLPPPGRYLVDINTPTRTFRAELLIDHEKIVWKHEGNDETKTINVLKKKEEGE